MDFFEFADPSMAGGLICVAPAHSVRSVFDERTFVRTFGGYCLYTDTSTDQIYIGVHGKRMAARFRRLMREGGVEFRLRSELPTSFSPGAKKAWSPKSEQSNPNP
jgi:hypothetical protein